MANLAFNINSFHYRYYMFIRYMWGCTDKQQRTSLCPYCQTMFWGSIFIVAFAWALVLGWICMKLGRMACKLQNPWTDAIVKYLDGKTKWIEALDSGPTDFVESPMRTAIDFCIMGVGVVIGVVGAAVIVGTLLGVVGFSLWNIVDIGAAILYCVAWVFSQLFMGLYWIGFGCHCAYLGTVWLFTSGELWYNVLCWTGTVVAWIAGVGIISVAICLLFIGISKLPLSKRFGKFLTNKFNGYSEAQEQRRARAHEAAKKLPPWKCEYCKYNNNSAENLYCQECSNMKPQPTNPLFHLLFVFYPVVWVIEKCVTVKNKIGSREIDIVGPVGILWSYIVAIKNGVCPIVEFVDPAQLQAEAQASAKDRMEQENESTESPSQTDD